MKNKSINMLLKILLIVLLLPFIPFYFVFKSEKISKKNKAVYSFVILLVYGIVGRFTKQPEPLPTEPQTSISIETTVTTTEIITTLTEPIETTIPTTYTTKATEPVTSVSVSSEPTEEITEAETIYVSDIFPCCFISDGNLIISSSKEVLCGISSSDLKGYIDTGFNYSNDVRVCFPGNTCLRFTKALSEVGTYAYINNDYEIEENYGSFDFLNNGFKLYDSSGTPATEISTFSIGDFDKMK